ncbi:MAG: hypothetical protein DMG72_23770, partial [Acidobacteria bacterium]
GSPIPRLVCGAMTRRAVAQSVREQRKRERELRRIDRTWRKIAESLEGKDDIQSKRLLYEITKDQRDRIEGKPFIAENRLRPAPPPLKPEPGS